MNVQIIKVDVTSQKSYQVAEVAYKNLTSGKVESKKILSFANKEVFTAMADAKEGDIFSVVNQKNDKGYWEWASVTKAPPGAAAGASLSTGSARSSYETAEERAKKQTYIVKQSSLANAIALLSVGAKSPPKLEEVLSVAQTLTDFVFDIQPEISLQQPFLPGEVE